MRFSVLCCLGLALLLNFCKSDESPGFFLKITKNVPRLGRRSDSSFLKNMRTIPRIGKREINSLKMNAASNWLEDMPSPSKRLLLSTHSLGTLDQELSVVQPVDSNTLIELLNKNAISADNIKFVHWKDFDHALLTDAELYDKVISLGRKPDQRLKQDLSLGSHAPFFASANDGGMDFVYYNQAENESPRAGNEFLRYNYFK